MFYISSKNGNNYGVTDTLDGVEEFYTVEQLKELVLRGLKINGCNYKDRVDLKENGFWSIDIQEKRTKIDIKVGKYYKFKFKDNNNKIQQSMGYCSKIDSSEYDFIYFILMDGNYIRVAYNNIISFMETRGISKDLRDLVSTRLQLSQLIEQKTNQIKVLKEEIAQLESKLNSMPAMSLETQGLITWDDFTNMVLLNMDKQLRWNLKNAGYRLITPCMVGIDDNSIYFTRENYVGNCRNYRFVYEEYDGTFHMESDADKDPKYRSCLRNNRKTIHTNLPFDESLYICEYTVMYQGWYKIIVPNESLTKELAVRLGKSLK